MNLAEIQDLAVSENLEKALKELKKFLASKADQELSPKVDLILGNLSEILDDQDLGIITYAEASAKKAGIRKSLLKFLQKAIEQYESVQRPLIFLAFANDPLVYMNALNQEENLIRETFMPFHNQEVMEYFSVGQATKDNIYNAFTRDFRDRIVIFHYSGHSNRHELKLNDTEGDLSIAYFLQLFDNQQELKLVFLNGCANKAQVEAFIQSGKLHDKIFIATSSPIDDHQSRDFAHQFYKSLSSGATVQKAFTEAQAFVGSTSYDIGIHRFLTAELERYPVHEKSWGLYYADEALLDWRFI